jgi:hypothetical protein
MKSALKTLTFTVAALALLSAGNAERVFTGNVSDDVIGQTLYMAGTMTVLDAAFGDLGEYNFSATR